MSNWILLFRPQLVEFAMNTRFPLIGDSTPLARIIANEVRKQEGDEFVQFNHSMSQNTGSFNMQEREMTGD
ncbi:hypothetical protein WN943_020160 [Citrus x changshan-huyou]